MARRTDDEIRERIDEFDKRHELLSPMGRMDIDGVTLVIRMSELQWVLNEG